MIGFSILSRLFSDIISTGLVDKIYHSVIAKKDSKGHIYPVGPVGNKYIELGPNDAKGFFCYCRQVGSIDNLKEDRVGSCGKKEYTLQVLHRLVFYSQKETRAHEDITAQLMKAVMLNASNIKFVKAITIPEQVALLESPTGKYQFQTNTYYVAIEFFVLLKILADECDTEIRCEGVANPFCKPQA